MPKILITGNGFDLSLGLPTSYGDFINILNSLDKYEDINFETIYRKSSNYSLLVENYKGFEFDYKEVEVLKNKINTNLWFQFFKNEFEIETWIDFENKIEYVLNILDSSVKNIKDKIFSKGSLMIDDIIYSSSLFNNRIEIIQVLNRFNIITLTDNNYVRLNTNYLIKKFEYYIDVDLNKITKKLITELNSFKRIFNLYFEIFVFPLYNNQKLMVDKTAFSTITKHYTFNYTPTFEKIYNHTKTTSFLHGKIDSNSNQIVLGISEIQNDVLDKRLFLPFTKYFQKLNINTDFKFITDFEKKKSFNYMFFFFGHSLDSSDEDYVNEVFDFVNNLKSSIKKIIIIHHNKKSKEQLLINLLNIRGKNDIIKLMKNETLVFNLVDSIELRRELKRDIEQYMIGIE